MDTLLEEHPLPPDTWGEAPQSPLVTLLDQSSPTTINPTTLSPHIYPED